ncbi:virulence factor Mce-like protein [Nocardia transvalensis]|uniref:Virulence factor Mce-like protein n=1 Tax=Nocardia transvalensis TaxID=37333 RepID=A0A7W9UK21_9NOCA|nr:MCE family protein [Nocardia transvalensis]MBB5915991.1 virulence factor Mce-like protein [Nocardia transvalensis]
MSIAFESDGKVLPGWNLFLRGLVVLVVCAAAAGLMIARSGGAFRQTLSVTADLVDVGDGLPAKSDVKYQGLLVGRVNGVTPARNGSPNQVHIDLIPDRSHGISSTVTARVVPSNVFAVPSVQLVYNGPGASLAAGAHIAEDRSVDTVRLQTSLTALSRIVAAAGRAGSDPTLGVLTAIERATAGHGEDAVRAGAELTRISGALNAAMAPDGTGATLDTLSEALTGLRSSAPDLLGAVHNSVLPLRTVEQQRQRLEAMLTGGLDTSATVATALENHTADLTGITAELSPPLSVIADGSRNFSQMTVSLARLSGPFSGMWDPVTQRATAKVIVELTPHRQYTRADCPRYGDLTGPSCATGPPGGPTIIGPDAAPAASPIVLGGTVGETGSPQEQARVAAVLGGAPNAAADILLGPLLRGNDVKVTPAPNDSSAPPGGPR